MIRTLPFLAFLLSPFILWAQSVTAEYILNNSIQYHDPENQLYEKDLSFHFDESRPDGTKRKTVVRLAPRTEHFQIESQQEDKHILTDIFKSKVRYYIDGKEEMDESILKEANLSSERSMRMKNYYLYLWHLPVKLLDEGTIIDHEVGSELFNEHECYKLKVTYEESVGKDIWYFYFDKKNYAMMGYRFYHDESKNDGEYIYLEDEYVHDLIRLPKTRKWYTHKEDKFLGTDSLMKMVETVSTPLIED